MFKSKIFQLFCILKIVYDTCEKSNYLCDNCKNVFVCLQDDLVRKSIYNFIHVGDHGQFSNCLLPMSLGIYLFDFLTRIFC